MKKNKLNKEIEEEIIFNSLGMLNDDEQKRLHKKINDLPSDSEEMKFVSEYNNLVSLIPKIPSKNLKNLSPSERVKENLFSKINSTKNKPAEKSKSFDFIFSGSGDWMQHPQVDGIKIKHLALNKKKNYAMILLKVEPNTKYPAHHHHGAEECYVIEGDVYAQGKTLGPGDFHHAEDGTDHEPLYTKNGCTLLLVVDPEDI